MTDRLTMTSDKGGVAFTFDLGITCEKSEIVKILKVAEKLKAYEEIGTVEECREARERQKEKKPVCRSVFTDGTRFPGCPTCFSRIDRGAFYCSGCGQKLDWH